MSRIRTQYAKITLLSFDEKPIKEIQGRISSGSISCNGNSAVRRTLNFQMLAAESGEDVNIQNKIKVEIGEERNGKIKWYKQGVYIVFNRTSSKSINGYKISISARDKMAQLDGTAGGTLVASVDFSIDADNNKVPIPQIIREAVMHFGGELDSNIFIHDLEDRAKMLVKYIGDEPIYFNHSYTAFSHTKDRNYFNEYSYGQDVGYRPMELIYTGELILKAGETVADLLKKLADYLGNFEYFYDTDGRFIFQQKKTYEQTLSPLSELVEEDYVSTYNNQNYSYKFINDEDIISINYNPKLSNLKNDFAVWGTKELADGQKITILYHLAIDKKPDIELAGQYFYQIKDKNTDLILRYEGRVAENITVSENEQATLIGKPCQEWREELYRQALRETVSSGYYSQYDKEILFYWRRIFDTMNESYNKDGWNPILESNPEQLNYWLDFIDEFSSIGEYSVNKIGRRSQVENKDDVKYLYSKEIPELIFVTPAEVNSEGANKWENAGYKTFQVPERYQDDFVMSSTGVSALDAIKDNLYKHLTFNASITITCLPKYDLELNTLVYVEDELSGIKGNYIITQFNMPLTYSGKMSITLTEAIAHNFVQVSKKPNDIEEYDVIFENNILYIKKAPAIQNGNILEVK